MTTLVRRWIGMLMFGLGLASAQVTSAQTSETVRYYHADAIGSVRMVTDQSGQAVQRYDYWPFGTVTDPAVSPEPVGFAGGARDPETSWHHFGARYADGQTGRFTSPDPLTMDALRLVSPQRWNRYAYANNNPLRYVDPEGLDAILVNFTDGALGFGHVGIMAVYPNGSGLYGGFAPARKGRMVDWGQVRNEEFSPGSIQFDPIGQLTPASQAYLRQRLSRLDGKSAGRIGLHQIKTSNADTAALESYLRRRIESPLPYLLGFNDCLDFCVRGLWSAGIPAPPPSMLIGGAVPDIYFRARLLEAASWISAWMDRPTPKVETFTCFQGIDC